MTASERENAAIFLEFTTVVPFTWLQGNYKCFYCDQVFTELHPLLQHTKTHDIPNHSSLLEKYIKNGKRVIKVDATGLKCRICELKYSELDDIRNHLVSVHKKVFSKAGNGLMAYKLSIASGSVACYRCGMEFTSFFSLNRHMNVHENVVCEICGLGFMTYQRLRNHRIVHQNGIHKCDLCQKVHTTKLKLRYHVLRYHEKTNVKKLKPQKCPHCLERFAEYYRKIRHLKEVHGITFKFECEACKAVYPTKRALTEHTRKNHLQNIVCKICGKCFGSSAALKIHSRGHTGERNFFCAVCQKTYMHEKLLRRHMKTHGYVFTCLLCGNGFLDKADLSKHKKQWHSDQTQSKDPEKALP